MGRRVPGVYPRAVVPVAKVDERPRTRRGGGAQPRGITRKTTRGTQAALEPAIVARETLVESDLVRLLLQIGGLVVTTLGIWLLVSLTSDPDENSSVEDDRPDRVFP